MIGSALKYEVKIKKSGGGSKSKSADSIAEDFQRYGAYQMASLFYIIQKYNQEIKGLIFTSEFVVKNKLEEIYHRGHESQNELNVKIEELKSNGEMELRNIDELIVKIKTSLDSVHKKIMKMAATNAIKRKLLKQELASILLNPIYGKEYEKSDLDKKSLDYHVDKVKELLSEKYYRALEFARIPHKMRVVFN